MTDVDLFRVYFDPAEIDDQMGYPWQWSIGYRTLDGIDEPSRGFIGTMPRRLPDVVRALAGHRCVRCGHPFVIGETPGQWSPCDDECDHVGPLGLIEDRLAWTAVPLAIDVRKPPRTAAETRQFAAATREPYPLIVVAEWRVLTVHHLNGVKTDCRWWNLAALCQRCHLTIQAKVHMQRRYRRAHTPWFQPYVAAYYASTFLGEELTREQTMARLDELLALEDRQMSLDEED